MCVSRVTRGTLQAIAVWAPHGDEIGLVWFGLECSLVLRTYSSPGNADVKAELGTTDGREVPLLQNMRRGLSFYSGAQSPVPQSASI